MDLIVTPGPEGYQATYGDKSWRCAVGRSGIGPKLAEGDNVSPLGCWPIRRIFYRADRLAAPPSTAIDCIAIASHDGWCDAPDHPAYNTLVRLPFPASHEEMWRQDALYDIVVVLGQNDDPVLPGKGSAIFLHVASPNYGPTAGCAALAQDDLLALLTMIGPETRLCFQQ